MFTPEDITDEHRLIAQTAQEFIDKEIVPRLNEIEEKKPGVLRELLKKAAELGFCATDVPQRFGGLELDKISSILVAGRNGARWLLGHHGGSASGHRHSPHYIFWHGRAEGEIPPQTRQRGVGGRLQPERGIVSLRRSELQDASHAAMPDGKHYILNGTKMWVTNGGIADVYVVFAKVDGEKFTAFIVERNFAGVSPGAEEHKMGIRGSSTTPLNLENVPVPVENVLGEIGKGHLIAFNILNMGRHRLGAGCVGGCKYLLADALKWAKERDAFGRKIADFGMIKEKLGEMVAQIYALESISYRTSGMIDAMLKGIDRGARDRAEANPGGLAGVCRGVLHPESYGHGDAGFHGRRGGANLRRLRVLPAATTLSAPTATSASIESSRAPTRSIAC